MPVYLMMNINVNNYTAHKGPGKFEGETAATEYFWEQFLDGDGDTIYAEIPIADGPDDFTYDEDAPVATIFTVMSEEAEAFGLKVGDKFMVREDSQGFVFGSVHANRKDAEQYFRNWLGIE